jgi:hypothetical protein
MAIAGLANTNEIITAAINLKFIIVLSVCTIESRVSGIRSQRNQTWSMACLVSVSFLAAEMGFSFGDAIKLRFRPSSWLASPGCHALQHSVAEYQAMQQGGGDMHDNNCEQHKCKRRVKPPQDRVKEITVREDSRNGLQAE